MKHMNTKKLLLWLVFSCGMFVMLTAETPYNPGQSQVFLSPDEQELDKLAQELVGLESSDGKEALVAKKQKILEALDELKAEEPRIKQIHNQFNKVKLKLKSFKNKCTFGDCRNVLRYTITNNSDQKITNFKYLLSIKHKGKVIYSDVFGPKIEKSVFPGASREIESEFDEDLEIYDMVLPKGTTTSLTLLEVQVDFEDWLSDQYEEYQTALKRGKALLKETENEIRQYDKNVEKRRQEIANRIAQLKQ